LTGLGMCDYLVEQTVREFGRLDILVSNAAHQARKKTLAEVTDQEFDLTFQTNIYPYFRLVRAAMRPTPLVLRRLKRKANSSR